MVSTKANNGYRGPALLIPKQGDEAIPVFVQFSVKQRGGGLRPWDGSISSTSGKLLFLEPGEYTLRLPNGREGIARVNRVALNVGSGGISETISFQGSGPSPLAD